MQSHDTPGSDSDRAARMAARQARLGIVPNPAEVTLPDLLPREGWATWYRLRAVRRRRARDASGDLER